MNYDCAVCSGCTVAGSCAATMTLYKDGACAMGPVAVPADNTCQAPPFTGTYASYKFVGTATTSCVASGVPAAASNAKMSPARTVCCRP